MHPAETALRLLAGVALILANGLFVGDGNRALERTRAMTGDPEAVAAPPMTSSSDTSVSDAIDRFQAESQELAVVPEDGEVLGLLTVTDALEAVVGDVRDPMDERAGVA